MRTRTSRQTCEIEDSPDLNSKNRRLRFLRVQFSCQLATPCPVLRRSGVAPKGQPGPQGTRPRTCFSPPPLPSQAGPGRSDCGFSAAGVAFWRHRQPACIAFATLNQNIEPPRPCQPSCAPFVDSPDSAHIFRGQTQFAVCRVPSPFNCVRVPFRRLAQ